MMQRASRAAPNLPPPLPGTLRAAAMACCERLLRVAASGLQVRPPAPAPAAPAPHPGPPAPAPAIPSLALALTAALSRKRRRTQSSPSSPDLHSPAARVREGPSPALSPAPPSREPSLPRLPYLLSGLPYLNMPPTNDTIPQLDGADDGDLLSPAATFQSAGPAAGMAEAGALELRPAPPPPPPPPRPPDCSRPVVRPALYWYRADDVSYGCFQRH